MKALWNDVLTTVVPEALEAQYAEPNNCVQEVEDHAPTGGKSTERPLRQKDHQLVRRHVDAPGAPVGKKDLLNNRDHKLRFVDGVPAPHVGAGSAVTFYCARWGAAVENAVFGQLLQAVDARGTRWRGHNPRTATCDGSSPSVEQQQRRGAKGLDPAAVFPRALLYVC
jgi:hypothetical protein